MKLLSPAALADIGFRKIQPTLPAWVAPAWKKFSPVAPFALLIVGRLLVDTEWDASRVLFQVLLFLFFFAFLERWSAVAATIGLEGALLNGSWIKEDATGEPLLTRDLFEVSQGAALTGYADWHLVAYVSMTVLAIGYGLYRHPRILSWRLLPALILPALFYVRMENPARLDDYVTPQLTNALHTEYLSYNFRENARSNGVLGHLYLNAETVPPPKHGPHNFYAAAPLRQFDATDPDVFVILCESCFTTEDSRFPTAVLRLRDDNGFALTHMVSPVYGGGTAEAEFEVLTGLSSKVFPGVDYQNFANTYRSDAHTIVSHFRKEGYHTYGLHDYYSTFWKRNIIYPKFGFDETHFVDEMNWNEEGWPDDTLLFDKVLSLYNQSPKKQKTMMFMATVMTHGKYVGANDDNGEADYRARLDKSIADMQHFVVALQKAAAKRKRPIMVVVFGDHKPGITAVFNHDGVLENNLFASVGARNEDFRFVPRLSPEQLGERGSIPVLVKYTGKQKTLASDMAENMTGRPLLCMPAQLAQTTDNQGRYFGTLARVCDNMKGYPYGEHGWEATLPTALYAERLF
ncbi:phosphoglycerol transferase MdoB-like AlkP superfamily enzyme [Silvimonas terrae]|uniref:Phosphoglycerol transferase MdoB-like AlkP superfamily enzyme n=1 Tax=Silvimonas terrae TaxID=300266 RepID=A0A840RIG0_9NEIS|nr:LTA synthase family protein [Silvimonas terrae]MBB5192308.1 phosphoglycerol transferase MdoB-like AlkP superfamily enzyme [Silvimonas terrae]